MGQVLILCFSLWPDLLRDGDFQGSNRNLHLGRPHIPDNQKSLQIQILLIAWCIGRI